MSVGNIDRQISFLERGDLISEREIKSLCKMVSEILEKEENVVRVDSPVIICGDIHGQFYDLLELFRVGGQVPFHNYIFMGDYVDRGRYSLETITYLLLLKTRYPKRIFLLRGNHESRIVSRNYTFEKECIFRFGCNNPWIHFNNVFDLLPISAIVSDKIFCVHGGLSPTSVTIKSINRLKRKKEIPPNGSMCDLLWSDPGDYISQWEHNPRGAGYIFGRRHVEEFCHLNDLKMMCRAHQLVMAGYRLQYRGRLATIWSAPNYCYRYGNLGSFLVVDERNGTKWTVFSQCHPDLRRGSGSREQGNNVVVGEEGEYISVPNFSPSDDVKEKYFI